MKKLIAILLSSTLTFAAVANAAKPDDKKAGPKSKAPPAPKQQPVAAPKVKAPKVQTTGPKVHAPKSPVVESRKPLQTKELKPTKQAPKLEKTTTAPAAETKELKPSKAPKVEKSTAPTTVESSQMPSTKTTRKVTTLPKEKIEQIRAQHKDFKAKPSSSIASATFNQNYQIAGAQNWTGPQYQVFASYRPQWHDRDWWTSRYSTNLALIAGGWYYWDGGYWYPAWGYDVDADYYPYDGPIYVGDTPRPFDQVVADVQATLQEQGYYKGEVDGLMGPLTRQALADFQRDHGLITTAALDQPTLSSLGLG